MLCRSIIAMMSVFFVPPAVHAQLNGFGANAYNGGAFGANIGGLGNAGGFATGGGLSNATTNSNYFGSNMVGSVRTYGGFSNGGYGMGALQSTPALGGYGYGNLNSGFGASAFGGLGGTLPLGIGTGMLPPNVTAELFSGQLPLTGSSGVGLGYTDFGSALNYAGLNYGGFGPAAFQGMAYPGMMYPGMAPGAMGYADPSIAGVAGVNGLEASLQGNNAAVRAPTAKPTVKPSAELTRRGAAAGSAGSQGELPAGRRLQSPPDDGVPRSTVTAARIQNRLNNLRSPNLTAVKVLMAGRTATLSGTVDSKADEGLAIRLVGLEPGVLTVKSELQSRSAN